MDQREIELLLTPAVMTPAEKEFRAWIKECKAILADRTVYEVAEMALMVGFDRGTVYLVLSTFQDAMNGTHIDNRAAYELFRETSYLKGTEASKEAATEEYRKTLSQRKFLKPLWEEYVARHVRGEAV